MLLPSSLAAGLPPDAVLLPALAAALPTGVVCAAPQRDATGQPVDFTLAYLNPAAQRLLGLAAAPPPATFAQLLPAQRPAEQLAQLAAAYQAPSAPLVALAAPVLGLPATLLATAQRVGEHLLVLLTATEPAAPTAQLTQLQQQRDAAHADAQRQRERLTRLFAQAPALVNTQLGPDHVFDLVHPLTYQLLGHRPLVGLPSRQALPELEGPFHALLDHVYQTGQPYYGREVHARLDRRGDGHLDEAYFDFTYQPLLDADGQVEGVMTFAVEVTAQLHARQQVEQLNQALEARVQERTAQLAQQATRLARLVQEAPAAIALLDGPDLVFELLNADYQALFPDRQLLGQPVLAALPELLETPLAEVLREVYRTGVTYRGHEAPIAFQRSDGRHESRYFDFIYQARHTVDGVVDGLVIFGFEVTERVLGRQQVEQLNQALRASNEELVRSNAKLGRANQDLDNFVYSASHDLKAPILNLEGLLRVLGEETATGHWGEPAAYVLRLMQAAVARFLTTLGHLTQVMHAEQDDGPPVEVDLARLIADVQLDLAALAASTQAQVSVEVEACPTLLVPAKTLRSVVYNLLSNALKYRHPARPPQVRFRCHQDAHQTRLEVQDNGLGLDGQQQAELFSLFRRHHAHVEGSGVGLYSVKRQVEHAGGRIEVRSHVGEGSTFSVTFPLPAPGEQEASPGVEE